MTIQTLNNRADLVSGGSALVQINVPQGVLASDLKIDVDGTDVTSAFATQADGRFMGLVKGLKNGNNTAWPGGNGTCLVSLGPQP